MNDSQVDQILRHLQAGNSITPMGALTHFGCFRLADVVFKLRKRGFDVQTHIEHVGRKQFASYALERG